MSYYEFTITTEAPFRDLLVQRLADAGSLGVIEQDDAVIAYFPPTADAKKVAHDLSIMQALFEAAGQVGVLTFEHTLIPDQDWNESWKRSFKPLDAGSQFTILPPWEERRPGRINIIIDPAMAFGTGHHETTRSCLILMEKYSSRSGKNDFLDLGTGTGILAVAAAGLGYRRVLGVDTDILAVEAARKNRILNAADCVEIREGSIADLHETYDFIAANLVSGVLVLMAPALAAHLRPGGIAVLSGILEGQDEEVYEAATDTGLKLLERYQDEKWISLAVERS